MKATTVTVVVRSSGERTLATCLAAIRNEIPDENIAVVDEAPFVKALEATYRIGITSNRPWLVVIDADIILRRGAIEQLVARFEQEPSPTFLVQGRVIDKLFGGPRFGGPRVYRCEYLGKALGAIDYDSAILRPESHVFKKMEILGNPWLSMPNVFGLHDFEQYYADIFRKAYVHAFKHRRFSGYFLDFWSQNALLDSDYRVALLGLLAGQEATASISMDRRHFPRDISILLASIGLSEKNPENLDFTVVGNVDSFIDGFIPLPTYQKFIELSARLDHPRYQQPYLPRKH